tara:strand:- start:143 stop:1129 length:987 start_codon:yes stop_codon:yes gene_type:complete
LKNSSIKNFLSLDAGASTIRLVIFNESGETLGSMIKKPGANISINPEESTKKIIKSISDVLENSSLSYEDISHYSLGIAGISDDRGREMLFKGLDEKKISNITHLSSDVNPVFEINCADNSAVLVSVGTGFVSLGRDLDNKIIKGGGEGLEVDSGSGYWMGKELILNLSFSRNIDQDENEFSELLNMTLKHYHATELNTILDEIMNSDDKYSAIASISEPLIHLGTRGNQIALSIIQQSTQYVAEYILTLTDQISYTNDKLIIIANGGILGNSFYRESLADALSFDFKHISWLFPSISTAYYPGLLSCKILGMNIKVEDILKENPIVS